MGISRINLSKKFQKCFLMNLESWILILVMVSVIKLQYLARNLQLYYMLFSQILRNNEKVTWSPVSPRVLYSANNINSICAVFFSLAVSLKVFIMVLWRVGHSSKVSAAKPPASPSAEKTSLNLSIRKSFPPSSIYEYTYIPTTRWYHSVIWRLYSVNWATHRIWKIYSASKRKTESFWRSL